MFGLLIYVLSLFKEAVMEVTNHMLLFVYLLLILFSDTIAKRWVAYRISNDEDIGATIHKLLESTQLGFYLVGFTWRVAFVVLSSALLSIFGMGKYLLDADEISFLIGLDFVQISLRSLMRGRVAGNLYEPHYG